MPQNCQQITTKTAEKPERHRVEPGKYFCNQQIDLVLMNNADILRSIDAITGVDVPTSEIYRMVTRICDQVHRSNKVLSDLKMIYK